MSVRTSLLIAAVALSLAGCANGGSGKVPNTLRASSPSATTGSTSLPTISMGLADYPILPTVSQHAHDIYQAGLAQGRNPQVFSKVGNCMAASPDFLAPFSGATYDLGEYETLQPTIDYYKAVTIREVDGKNVDSFSNPSLAAASGFTSAGPLDHIWANSNFCNADETPLACEFRLSNPSMALILFGTNDVYYLDADKFDRYMRQIMDATLEQNILPVLITFPPLPDRLDETKQFNQIVVNIAGEYDVPLINLWKALVDLPGYGVDPDHFTRLTVPADGCAGCLTQAGLQAGITNENLVLLQSLDVLRRELSK